MKNATTAGILGCLLLAGCGAPVAAPTLLPQISTKQETPVNPVSSPPSATTVAEPNDTPVTRQPSTSMGSPSTNTTAQVVPSPTTTPSKTAPKPAVPATHPNVDYWTHEPPLRDKGKNVVLTFDDGPSPDTAGLIQTVTRENVPAIFFWNTYHIHYADSTVLSLLAKASDITVGDHTVDHPNMNHLGYNAQFNEIVNARTTIQNILGKPVVFYRPPYGNFDSTTEKILNQQHMTCVMWNVDSLDWKYNSDEKATLKEIEGELHPGSIILLHDHPYTVKYLPDIIAMIRKDGYGFTTLTEPSQS